MNLLPRTRSAPNREPVKVDHVPVLMRFLTLGGATVELRSHRFTTRFYYQGHRHWDDRPRQVDGFVWECLGCNTKGHAGYPDDGGESYYLPQERGKAREHANDHASTCRAMPAPGGGR